MFKRACAAAVLFAAVPAMAQDAPPPAPPSPATPAPKLTEEELAKDPRMIAAIHHANVTADRKCGDTGGFVPLEVKAQGRACRKRMVDAAKADAEFEITNSH